ncbi:hypothetical protein [Clostridium scatologenes]|uniref:Uncharacterized protein n=1 Tax=Clostridium scatologenes TaxID=1548 RepID=A0A0E3JML4_CLOSL|nr:hypothetical protein [Clostridium scatologenes]AKA68179.1 hypothetical protein CSCA_1054 [Clostridium scatologenes]
MTSVLSTNYNYNLNNNIETKNTDTTAASKLTTELTSNSKDSSVDDYIKELSSKFPNLKFQVGLGGLAPGKLMPPDVKGLGNIRIDPTYLKKVASDPKAAEDLEAKLQWEPAAEAWLKSMYALQGRKVVSTVTGIDKNGDFFSGAITEPINSKSNSDSDSKSKKEAGKLSPIDLNEILQEKFRKLTNQKEAEAKRLELMSETNPNAANLQKKVAKNYNKNLFNTNLINSNR